MDYAVSLNGKLYIISIDDSKNVLKQLRDKLKDTLDIDAELGSYFKVSRYEYDNNTLSNEDPQKLKRYFSELGDKYEFYNKDIVYINF